MARWQECKIARNQIARSRMAGSVQCAIHSDAGKVDSRQSAVGSDVGKRGVKAKRSPAEGHCSADQWSAAFCVLRVAFCVLRFMFCVAPANGRLQSTVVSSSTASGNNAAASRKKPSPLQRNDAAIWGRWHAPRSLTADPKHRMRVTEEVPAAATTAEKSGQQE